jgi:hypothetical protein
MASYPEMLKGLNAVELRGVRRRAIAAYCLLLPAYCLLLTAHCSLLTNFYV